MSVQDEGVPPAQAWSARTDPAGTWPPSQMQPGASLSDLGACRPPRPGAVALSAPSSPPAPRRRGDKAQLPNCCLGAPPTADRQRRKSWRVPASALAPLPPWCRGGGTSPSPRGSPSSSGRKPHLVPSVRQPLWSPGGMGGRSAPLSLGFWGPVINPARVRGWRKRAAPFKGGKNPTPEPVQAGCLRRVTWLGCLIDAPGQSDPSRTQCAAGAQFAVEAQALPPQSPRGSFLSLV